MDDVDLNLLPALDALLAEGSVSRAARRLGLSPSAMSRTLARLRAATADELLVRAGRGLVPTPRAIELRDRVHELAREARAVLRPRPTRFAPDTLDLTFTIRASDAFMAMLSGPVAAAVTHTAPGVRLRFVPKPDKDAQPLRDGSADLEIGVPGTSAPEIRVQPLLRDMLVGVAQAGHPLLAGDLTPERFATCRHVVASPDGRAPHPVDAALEALSLRRTVAVIVPGYPDAMRIARLSDLVAVTPRSCLGNALIGPHPSCEGLETFELPLPLPAFRVCALWHPRLDADPAHRWLRTTVMEVCRAAYPRRPGHA